MLGIYCRISQLKEEGKDRSIHDQKQLGIEFAQSIGSEYKVYIDEGVSGTLPVKERPQLVKMLEDIEEGIIDSVYVYMQDRLERSTRARFFIRSIFERNNVTLYTSSGKVNRDDDEQTLMGDIFSLVNEWEVKKTRKRVKSVLYRNAKEGIYQGIVPYGYTKTKEKVHIVDEDESKIVQRIFDLSLQGNGVAKIAEILNDEGIPTRYNKLKNGTLSTRDKFSGKVRTTAKSAIKWSGQTIYGILNNSSYKGEKIYNGEVLPYPIIIDPVQWDRVKKNIQSNRNNTGKSVKHKYLLRGKILCGKCQRNYYGRTRVNKKDNFYMCSSKRRGEENCGNRSINIGISEGFIWDRFFVDGLLREKTREYLVSGSPEKSIEKIERDVKSLEKKIKGLKVERSRISELLIKGIFDEEDAQIQLEANRKKVSELNITLQAKRDELQFHIDCIDNVKHFTQDLKNIQKNADFNHKKELIDKYIKNIVISYIKELRVYSLIVSFNMPEMTDEHYFIDVNYSVAKGMNAVNKVEIFIPLSDKAKTLSIEELKERVVTFKHGKYLDKPFEELTEKELENATIEIQREIAKSKEFIEKQRGQLQGLKDEYNEKKNALKKQKRADSR
jgi:site-specific DNA recombinase